MTPSPVDGLHLRRTDENVEEIDALASLLGGRQGVDGVLENQNRLGRGARIPGRAVARGFGWNDEDNASRRWWPQGISTSADASATEDISGRRVLVTSWYSKRLGGLNKGSRLTFVDLDTLRYRHVLLVVPTVDRQGRSTFEPLNVHAGGIVWCGPYLHVAGTKKGLFTCRVDDILRIPSGLADGDRARIGVDHGGDRPRVTAYGYPWILPVRFSYEAHTGEGHEQLRYSFLSLDRGASPAALVAGEYGRGDMSTRLVRYPLDPESSHIVTGDDGSARPLQLDTHGVGHMQGATVVGGTWYVTASRGALGLGSVYVGTPGSFERHRWAMPPGPEDISYWPSTDQLWSVSEYPHRRYVFAMDRSSFD